MTSSDSTHPRTPDGDAPLSEADVVRILENIPLNLMLIGGQALAFWLSYYSVAVQEASVITSDADFLGDVAGATQMAKALAGTLVIPPTSARTALVAQIRISVTDSSLKKNIDVLHKLYTVGSLRKMGDFTKKAIHRASLVQYGKLPIKIMHPLDVLHSRVANAAGLIGSKGPHVITQAKWAISMVSQVLLNPVNDTQRMGGAVQEVYDLAHSAAGRIIYKDYGLEVFDAVPCDDLRKTHPPLTLHLDRLQAGTKKKRATDDASVANYRQARGISGV